MGSVAHLPSARSQQRSESDAELVERAQSGDPAGFSQLYRRHANAMYGLAVRLTARPDDAADLTQEAFAQAFESLHRLREPAAFSRWLKSILVRTMSKRIRRRSVAQRIGLIHSRTYDIERLVSASAPTEAAVELRRIYRALDQLPGDAGVALILNRVEGLSLPEVAEYMGVSVPTVKRRLSRARIALEAYDE